MMKIATIVGARPQFVKAAVVSRAIGDHNRTSQDKSGRIDETIIHTGQHYDHNMSDVFFDEMHIPRPKHHLGIKNLSHGAMTGHMLEKLEAVLQDEKPSIVLVYGDTNTTLAGALAATKLHIPVAHVEAGLRSFNRLMPEEVNRVLTDHVSNILFCPTKQAVKNLKREGIGKIYSSAVRINYDEDVKKRKIRKNSTAVQLKKLMKAPPTVALVGDVMLDAALFYKEYSRRPEFNVPASFVLATIHRAENTDDPKRLKSILRALQRISREMAVILPLHPRTRSLFNALGLKICADNLRIIDPVGYLNMVYLLERCTLVITDSGGLQKEAFFFKKPCITVRDETEWVELVENGLNVVAGTNVHNIYNAFRNMAERKLDFGKKLYGDGRAGDKIVKMMLNFVKL